MRGIIEKKCCFRCWRSRAFSSINRARRRQFVGARAQNLELWDSFFGVYFYLYLDRRAVERPLQVHNVSTTYPAPSSSIAASTCLLKILAMRALSGEIVFMNSGFLELGLSLMTYSAKAITDFLHRRTFATSLTYVFPLIE